MIKLHHMIDIIASDPTRYTSHEQVAEAFARQEMIEIMRSPSRTKRLGDPAIERGAFHLEPGNDHEFFFLTVPPGRGYIYHYFTVRTFAEEAAEYRWSMAREADPTINGWRIDGEYQSPDMVSQYVQGDWEAVSRQSWDVNDGVQRVVFGQYVVHYN